MDSFKSCFSPKIMFPSYAVHKTITDNKIVLLVSLIVFNILFPKSGIKISDIPITIGNVVFVFVMIYTLARGGLNKVKNSEYLIYIFVGYWLLRLAIGYMLEDNAAFSSFISYIVPMCFYPFAYFFMVRFVDSGFVIEKIVSWINVSVWFVVIYAFVQFLFGIGTVQIPFLTVNYSDYVEAPQSWWLEKCNGLAYESAKTVSTYQNGNLLGANLLLLCPLVYIATKKTAYKTIFFILSLGAVFLAGSRSMYLAIVLFALYKFLSFIYYNPKMRFSLLNIILISIGLSGIIVFFINNASDDFLRRFWSITDMDTIKSGTGRVENFATYCNWMMRQDTIMDVVFGSYGASFKGGAYEMLYASLFVLGGLVGLALPIYCFISIFKSNHIGNYLQNGIKDGFILYAFAAISEGAFWLPPLALNLWMMLGLHGCIGTNSKIQFS